MQTKTNVVEKEQYETDRELKAYYMEKLEALFRGVRAQVTNPIPACEKLDKMFGSGGEAIVHYMWFEQGLKLFDQMIQNTPNKNREELLKELIDIQPLTGWGTATTTIARQNPPTIEVVVKNPPVKTVKGSQKHLIGSFWAGVFSRYFDKQLACTNFSYNAERDEFSCVVT